MTKLNDLLQTWTETKDIENLIDDGFLTHQEVIQADLEKMPEPEQATALKVLSEIASALALYISEMDVLKTEVKSQIEQNLKSAQACLSYGSASSLDKKSRDKS